MIRPNMKAIMQYTADVVLDVNQNANIAIMITPNTNM